MAFPPSNSTFITQDNFPDIYNDNYMLLMKYTFSIVRNKQMAQDIVADLFCELWESRNRISIHTNLQNYLLVSARRMASRQLAKANNPSYVLHAVDAMEEDPYSKFFNKESTDLLNGLLASLSSQKRDIVQLRLIGLTYNQIASALNLTPKKVEYQLNTAINLLHEEVKSKPHLKELAVLLLLPQLVNEVTIW